MYSKYDTEGREKLQSEIIGTGSRSTYYSTSHKSRVEENRE